MSSKPKSQTKKSFIQIKKPGTKSVTQKIKKDIIARKPKLVQVPKKKMGKLGIIEDVVKAVDLGISVVDTAVSTFENPIDGIMNKLPNTVAKFVDAMGGSKTSLDPKAPGQVSISGEISSTKDEKFVDALKKQMPTVQLQTIPSAYASEYKAPPLVTKDVTWNGIACTRVSGSVILGAVSHGATEPTLNRKETRILNPQILGGQIATMSSLHQRHLWLNVGLFYIPSCASTVKGSVILTFQNSPNTTYTPTTNINLLSQRDHFTMTHVFKGVSLPLIANFKQQYNRPSGGPASDIKFYADWAFEAWTYQADGQGDIYLGSWGLTYDVLFFSRIEADNIIQTDYSEILGVMMTYSGLSRKVALEAIDKLLDAYARQFDEQSITPPALSLDVHTSRQLMDEVATIDDVAALLCIDQTNCNSNQRKFLVAIGYLFLSYYPVIAAIKRFVITDDNNFRPYLHLLSLVREWAEEDDMEVSLSSIFKEL